MIIRKQYTTAEAKEILIQEYAQQNMRAVVSEELLEGNFLTFATLEDEDIIFNKPPTDNDSILKLEQKVAEQDMVLEEIMFIIIPEIMGGGM